MLVSLLDVNPIDHFEQNRPVHLALRDVYYMRATYLLKSSKEIEMQGLDADDYEEILFLLRSARKHGRFVIRSHIKNDNNTQFCNFINMLVGNVKAVLSMLNLKHSVEAKDGFFFSFLEVNHASVALQAEEYERRSRDIIRCLCSTLNLSTAAYEELKGKNDKAFSPFERERYDKAAKHYTALIEKTPFLPQYKKRLGFFA